jgi:pimeloyl-ACP methyl ester carboxylesterase
VNGLNTYYEIHGTGWPLVVLHGAYMTIETITPELFADTPLLEEYTRVAPDPDDFSTLVAKLKRLDMEPFAWPPEDIEAPTLIVVGDSDAIRLEHAVEMFRLLGGGVMGDPSDLPGSRLAVLPGTTHFVPPGFGVLDRADWLVAMIGEFLDAPVQESG